MKSNGNLQKYYDLLDSRERFSLAMAAAKRNDMAELEALNQSAPRITLRIPQHYGMTQSYLITSLYHLSAQFENGMNLLALLHFTTSTDDDDKADETFNAVQIAAFKILQYKEAWQRFCQSVHINDSEQDIFFPNDASLHFIEDLAEKLKFTPEEAERAYKQRNGESAEMMTAEKLAQTYQECFDSNSTRLGA